ncbi:hypothetical protein [Formosa agariphila]|uniref:hypothetical protein n=1 Tax=Formosa agariphila TaxID=320324 RepID=UPI0005702CD0|nr:hypothetical protein [Formosa agariphila]
MPNHLKYIFQAFPNFKEKIEFMFHHNENFHDLCEDYLLCINKILELKKDNSHHSIHIQEYQDIQNDLEREIFQIISKAD